LSLIIPQFLELYLKLTAEAVLSYWSTWSGFHQWFAMIVVEDQ
jgi:hypothetical protein